MTTKEPFACLRNQGLVVANSYKKASGAYVEPDQVFRKGGAFYELGTSEPVEQLLEKMGKSKLNGVSPDEIIEEFGADSLRLYEMFMSPFDREKVWKTEALLGVYRFLCRAYDMCTSEKVSETSSKGADRLIGRLILGVAADLERMQFNTAIAKMMEFINAFTPLEHYPVSALLAFVQVLYPFAPHLSSELWKQLGGEGAIEDKDLPTVDPKRLEESSVPYIVQVNGRHRGTFKLAKDLSEDNLKAIVIEDPSISKHLEGTIAKVIFVPNRLINFVVK